jgi:regulator of protease activity HflC (stomatin/prohibitin superfamily)
MRLLELLTLGLLQYAVVRQGEVRVIEQRGRFSRVANPGVAVLVTLWGYGETIGRFRISEIRHDAAGRAFVAPREGVEVIPTRMQVDDYPKESIITRDNATVFIDAVVFYRLVDPKRAVYEVRDYVGALQKLVQSALRDEAGKYELDELLVSRDKINTALRISLDEATDPWGIKVERVEIKDIDLGEFGQILAEQRAAETRRRTEITQAEGHKRAAVLSSEGDREAAILKAQGDREALILRAQAEKEAAILRAQAAKEAEVLAAEARAEATLKLREAEARGYRMLQQVLQGDEQVTGTLLRVLELQKAAEVGERLADGQSTKIFLPAGLDGVFGLVAGAAEATREGSSRRGSGGPSPRSS